MEVIIIGAGVGGLSAGILLQKLGHKVTVYERVVEVKPVGAAISIWSNGVKCLNYLGLSQQTSELGGQMDAMAYVDGLSGDVMTQFSLSPLYERVGQRPYPVSRAELQLMLMREFGEQNIHLGKEMVSLKESDNKVIATFADGSEKIADLLIGSDGAKSIVRDYVRDEPTVREYAGYVNWNGLIEIDESLAPKDQWTTFVGEGKRVSLMPIANNRFYFFFDVPIEAGLPAERALIKEELRNYFNGWATPVQQLIEQINVETTNRVEVFDVEPFTKWVRGNVIILGDSAHNTSPDLGQGACMALEDSVVLEQCFLAHSELSIADICLRYQNLRVERAKKLVLGARKRNHVTHGKEPKVTQQWYEELRQETGENIMNGIAGNIEGGPFG